MAMTDYFRPCNILETKTVSDGLGGYEVVEYVGLEIEGLVARQSANEQLVGAIRGQEAIQYNFHTYASVPLDKDNKIMYTEDGKTKYIRLTSSAVINEPKSGQGVWKSYTAESYTPASVISA